VPNMRVLRGTLAHIVGKRRVIFPPARETVAVRGFDRAVPDLTCGACGAVLACGVPTLEVVVAIGCNECGAINAADGLSG
jgi:hypothetical protein